jgi:hypothetical protein
MDAVHMQIWGILILYCVILTWLSVPFVTTDKDVLRRQVLFVENLEQQIVADSSMVQ